MSLDDEFKRALDREAEVGFAGLSHRDQLLYTIWWLEADVNNGGFDQYYFNAGGDHACLAPGMLRAIGADHMAAIVESANAIFGTNGPPSNRDERQDTLSALTESEAPWGTLDQQYWAYPDNISKLLERYLGARSVA
jgi:hypothetical protein